MFIRVIYIRISGSIVSRTRKMGIMGGLVTLEEKARARLRTHENERTRAHAETRPAGMYGNLSSFIIFGILIFDHRTPYR